MAVAWLEGYCKLHTGKQLVEYCTLNATTFFNMQRQTLKSNSEAPTCLDSKPCSLHLKLQVVNKL